MRNIRLNNKAVYQVDRCGAAGERLIINVVHEGYKLLELVETFGRAENVETIEHYFDGTETDHVWFKGYTALLSANVSDTGTMLILKKE